MAKKNSFEDSSPLDGVDKLFSKTSKPKKLKAENDIPKESSSKPKRGRKKKIQGSKMTSVMLRAEQLEWMDEFVYKSKKRGSGSFLSNSALFRACLDIVKLADVNNLMIEDEEDLRNRLIEAFQKL